MSLKLVLLLCIQLLVGVASFAPHTSKLGAQNLHHHDAQLLDDDISPVNHDSGSLEQCNIQRRVFISSFVPSVLGLSSPAHAAKGAAEYDFEYYMRDLL